MKFLYAVLGWVWYAILKFVPVFYVMGGAGLGILIQKYFKIL